jgi:hypothetical protein
MGVQPIYLSRAVGSLLDSVIGAANFEDLGGRKPGAPHRGRKVERTPSSSALR